MSCVCILTPLVIAGWPAFSAAVTAAAVSLGYTVADQCKETLDSRHGDSTTKAPRRIQLEIDQSEIVTSELARDKTITVKRDGVAVTFSRDARGKASLCVEGVGYSDEALRAMGEEMSARVVQQYVYQRLTSEMRKRDFTVVEEEVGRDRSMRLKVRRWEN